MNVFPSYSPDTQVWFIIRDEANKPVLWHGVVKTTVMTTYISKDGITHEAYYVISECDDHKGHTLELELNACQAYGSKAEAEKHMPQIINK